MMVIVVIPALDISHPYVRNTLRNEQTRRLYVAWIHPDNSSSLLVQQAETGRHPFMLLTTLSSAWTTIFTK
jgi:hypothetical protein